MFAVIFRNEREELVVRAIEALNEEKAIEHVIAQWNEEYADEGVYPLFDIRAVRIENGIGIYHEDRS